MAQTQVFRGVQTTVAKEGNILRGFYRGTNVASIERTDGKRIITLRTGGWKTNTTKTRMNQFSHQFCNSMYSVYQEKGDWFVYNRATNETYDFDSDYLKFEV